MFLWIRLKWQFPRGIANLVKRPLLLGRSGLLAVSILLLLLINFNLVSRVWRRDASSVRRNSVDVNVTTGRQFQEVRYSEVLDKLDSLVCNDTLYPDSYDVEEALSALRHAKIVHADLMLVTSSYKWILTLEGGHQAIFKPMTVPKSRRFQHCFNFHCEHPEYEIAAFTLNRMLGLRNMPFTTGRVLSWWNEVLPVATKRLVHQYRNVSTDDGTLYARTVCNLQNDKVFYSFPGGRVPGAMMYYLKDKVRIFVDGNSVFYDYKIAKLLHSKNKTDTIRKLDHLPGDDSYCKIFRQKKRYVHDRWFADVTDLTVMDFLLSHLDSSHTYINRSNGEVMNVMVDFGRSFCIYPEHLRIAAPITQCCKVRKRVYESLVKYRDNLLEVLESMTRTDPFHPLLEPDLKELVRSRQGQLLSLIDYCKALRNVSNVMMDI